MHLFSAIEMVSMSLVDTLLAPISSGSVGVHEHARRTSALRLPSGFSFLTLVSCYQCSCIVPPFPNISVQPLYIQKGSDLWGYLDYRLHCFNLPLLTFHPAIVIPSQYTVRQMYQRSLGPGQGDPLGITIVVLDCVLLSLAAVAICIRLWSRKIQGLGFYLNDYAAVLAWVWRRLVPIYHHQLTIQASRSRLSCFFGDK